MSDTSLNTNVASSLAISVPLALFTALMPPVTDLWMTKQGTVTSDMVRSAEFIAGTISLSVGLVISIMADSPAPFFLTLLVSGAIAGAYESILRKDILDEHR